MASDLNTELLLKSLADATSSDYEKRAAALEYCAVERWKPSWQALLQVLYEYFMNPQSVDAYFHTRANLPPNLSRFIFWAMQVLEASVKLMDSEMVKQFLVAVLPRLQNEQDQIYVSIPIFIRNRVGFLLARWFFCFPDIVGELLMLLKVDLLIRVCVSFDEIINTQTAMEKELLKKYLPVLFDRLAGIITAATAALTPASGSASSSENSTNALGAIRVMSCYVEWCDINLIFKYTSLFNGLFMQPEYAAAVADLFGELVRKGMPPENKLAFFNDFAFHQYFEILFSQSMDETVRESMCKLLNYIGCELCAIHAANGALSQHREQAFKMLTERYLGYYSKFYLENSWLQQQDDPEPDDVNDYSLEMAEFSYQLIQLYVKRKDEVTLSSLLQMLLEKLRAYPVLLGSTMPLIDLISANFPHVAMSQVSLGTLFLLTSLGESKGRGFFMDNNSLLTSNGAVLVQMLTGLCSQQSTLTPFQVEFISRSSYIFNLVIPETTALYLQLVNVLMGAVQNSADLRMPAIGAVNKLFKTKAVKLIQNNQQVISCNVSALFQLLLNQQRFQQLQQQQSLKNSELTNEGFASLGQLINDNTIIAELVGHLNRVVLEFPTEKYPLFAIGYLIKGLLASENVKLPMPAFEPLYSTCLQLLMSNSSMNPAVNIEAGEELRDALCFCMVKQCQILKRCDLVLFQEFFPTHTAELYALLQFSSFKSGIVNAQVLEYLLDYSFKHIDDLGNAALLLSNASVLGGGSLAYLDNFFAFCGAVLSKILANLSTSNNNAVNNNDLGSALKAVIVFYCKHPASQQSFVELVQKIQNLLATLPQNDASLLSFLSEYYVLLRQNLEIVRLFMAEDAELTKILMLANEREGKRLFREYFRQQKQRA